ncbi:antitoxin Xre/MbcA/ParS toxin-binding domain-containing protein [Henriciella aquimarina]|uniref:antitoxin Xre/MbcA/ParS toxin-binding domain-containing protein n=1 Tax=Henriciella aquimarina TaxID=545261 RepID=UPI000A05426F|nr:antitoxin Xre/MbcA/ParS toxin-binding domain-containing protein [Henriciella aquimarina]
MTLHLVDKQPGAEADPMISDEEGAALARAAINLFRHWGITDREACTLLGGLSTRTYARWKDGEIGRLTVDQKTRLSVLMGIHKALRMLFTDQERVHRWIKKPNAAFNGRSALDLMLRGYLTDMFRVRHYLDAARG